MAEKNSGTVDASGRGPPLLGRLDVPETVRPVAVRTTVLAWYLLLGVGSLEFVDGRDPRRTLSLLERWLTPTSLGALAIALALLVGLTVRRDRDSWVDLARIVRTSILYPLVLASVYFGAPLLRGWVGV